MGFMFRSYAQAAADVRAWSQSLPENIVAVTGVPRSGSIIGLLLAQHRNIHFVEWSQILRGEQPWTMPLRRKVPAKPRHGVVLAVDDTSYSGRTIRDLKPLVPNNVQFGALYVGEGGAAIVDHWHAMAPCWSHSFEWNLLHDTPTKHVCADLDGTLCEDWTLPGEDGEFAERYATHLRHARKIRGTSYPLYAVVTARLERYRSQTEDWLHRNGIQFQRLIMCPAKSTAERTAMGFGQWKAKVYSEHEHATLFVENDHRQAETIHKLTKKAVLSSDRMQVLGGLEPVPRSAVRTKHGLRVAIYVPSLGMGGAERAFVDLAIEWRKSRAVTITGICLVDEGQSWDAYCRELMPCPIFGARPHPTLPNSDLVTRMGSERDAFIAASTGADVILTWGLSDIGERIKGLWSKPVVSICQGASREVEALIHAATTGSTHFVAVSSAAASMFPESVRSRVKVIPNGVNIPRSIPASRKDARAATRAAWGVEDQVLIGHVGRLDYEKNPLAVVRAAKLMGATAVLVGNGFAWERIVREAKEIDPSVIVPGPVDSPRDAFAAIDCFVLASPLEGDSIALKEAMVSGVPIVATRVGGLPDLETEHGKLCISVPPGVDDQSLVDAIRQAMHPDNMGTIAHAARTITTRFNAAVIANQWAEFLKVVKAEHV